VSAELPAGFALEPAPGRALIARPEHLQALVRAGLLEPRVWERTSESSATGGRGPTGTLALEGSLVLRLKRMRRGGLARHIWRDRFAGTRRLLANLGGPVTALERGVPTAEPIALLIERGSLGLSRGWLATRDVPRAESLAARLLSRRPPGLAELRAVVDAVRQMHDRGIDHRDLNVGNVLLRDDPPCSVLMIDLDRARITEGALSERRRTCAVRRLERSTVKLLGLAPVVAGIDLRAFWYDAYAEGAPALRSRLASARRLNRCAIALHRLGWKRPGAPPPSRPTAP
jgi:hypothetical protein